MDPTQDINIEKLLENYPGDSMPGGEGDNFDLDLLSMDEFEDGIESELEHTKDPNIAIDIIKDHEKETMDATGEPEYYKEYLLPMEDQMKEDGKENKEEVGEKAAMNYMFINSKTALVKIAATAITNEEIEIEKLAKEIHQYGNILAYSVDIKGPIKHITFRLAEDKDSFVEDDRELEDEFNRTDKDQPKIVAKWFYGKKSATCNPAHRKDTAIPKCLPSRSISSSKCPAWLNI